MNIHPHSNRDIKTGTMAGYEEPMPSYLPPISDKTIKKWREQSLIGYVKESVFKVDRFVWWEKLRYRIVEVTNNWVRLSDKMSGDEGFMITKDMYSQLSHYYHGQQLPREGFRWVKEVLVIVKGHSVRKKEWQQVEEPEPMIIDGGNINYPIPTYEPNPDYDTFRLSTQSGETVLEEIKP